MFLFEKHGGDTLKPGQNQQLYVLAKKSTAIFFEYRTWWIKYAGFCKTWVKIWRKALIVMQT
jgi:hypothetical protein